MRVLVRKEVSIVLVLHIFGADTFLPWICVAAICNCRRPGHGEEAFILHREFELQALAPVAGIDNGANGWPFFFSSIQRFFGGLIVTETEALDPMHGWRIRTAETRHHP